MAQSQCLPKHTFPNSSASSRIKFTLNCIPTYLTLCESHSHFFITSTIHYTNHHHNVNGVIHLWNSFVSSSATFAKYAYGQVVPCCVVVAKMYLFVVYIRILVINKCCTSQQKTLYSGGGSYNNARASVDRIFEFDKFYS